MKINEVEELLGVSRANIRYYEKEGLLTVKRGENKYRDYSEEDIETLKRIIIFRKIGIPVENIRQILSGEFPLDNALEDNIKKLEAEIESLKGALDISRRMKKEKAAIEDFDSEYYWKEITDSEDSGIEFEDICKDYKSYQKFIFNQCVKYFVKEDWDHLISQHGILKAIGIIMGFILFRALLRTWIWKDDFWWELLFPVIVFSSLLLISLPCFLLYKKHPKAAAVYINAILFICIGFLGLILLLLVVSLLNAVFHFWF